MSRTVYVLLLGGLLSAAVLALGHQAQTPQPNSSEQVTTPPQPATAQPTTPINRAPDTAAPPPQKHAPSAAHVRRQDAKKHTGAARHQHRAKRHKKSTTPQAPQ